MNYTRHKPRSATTNFNCRMLHNKTKLTHSSSFISLHSSITVILTSAEKLYYLTMRYRKKVKRLKAQRFCIHWEEFVSTYETRTQHQEERKKKARKKEPKLYTVQ